jgi:hypothetical protein
VDCQRPSGDRVGAQAVRLGVQRPVDGRQPRAPYVGLDGRLVLAVGRQEEDIRVVQDAGGGLELLNRRFRRRR